MTTTPTPPRRRWFQFTLCAALFSAALVNMATGDAPLAKNANSTSGDQSSTIPPEYIPLFESSYKRHELDLKRAKKELAFRNKEYEKALKINETSEAKYLLRRAEEAFKNAQADRSFRPFYYNDLDKPGEGRLSKEFTVVAVVGEKRLECVDHFGKPFYIEGRDAKQDEAFYLDEAVLVFAPEQRSGRMTRRIRVLDQNALRRLYDRWLYEREPPERDNRKVPNDLYNLLRTAENPAWQQLTPSAHAQ